MAVDAHDLPNKKSAIPILPMAGIPDVKRNPVMRMTKATAKNPQSVKIIFIDFSIKFAAFFILLILYTPYLATGTAPAFTIKSSATSDVAKSKNAFAVSESSAFFFVTNTKLR